MPKRLTAAELGDDGAMPAFTQGRRLLVEAEVIVGYPGSKVSDLLIGNHTVQVPNDQLRRAALQAEMKEPTLPKAQRPVAYLRDLDGSGSMHVCAKGDPGAIPVYSA